MLIGKIGISVTYLLTQFVDDNDFIAAYPQHVKHKNTFFSIYVLFITSSVLA